MALDLLSISDHASTCYNSNSPCDGGRAAYKRIDDISLPVRSTFAGISYQWSNVPRMSTTGGFYGRRGATVSERVTCKCKDKNKKVIKEINPCRTGTPKKKQKTKKQKAKMTAGRLLGIVNYRRAYRPMHACNKKKSCPKYKSSCTFMHSHAHHSTASRRQSQTQHHHRYRWQQRPSHPSSKRAPR